MEFNTPEWMGPHEWVFERIRTETGRVGSRANALAKELTEMHPSFRETLITWWRTGAINMDLEVEGWSIRSLIDRHQCKYVSEALTWLSHLTIDAEGTKALLRTPIHLHLGPPLEQPAKVVIH